MPPIIYTGIKRTAPFDVELKFELNSSKLMLILPKNLEMIAVNQGHFAGRKSFSIIL